jgi:hypothetical protein
MNEGRGGTIGLERKGARQSRLTVKITMGGNMSKHDAARRAFASV